MEKEIKETEKQIEVENKKVKMKVDKSGVHVTRKETKENTNFETKIMPKPNRK